MANFGNINTDAGLRKLDEHLLNFSYVGGYFLSSADVSLFNSFQKRPNPESFPHASRWYKHISGLSEYRISSLAGAPASTAPASTQAPKAKKPAEDDFDLFGEEDTAEAEENARRRESSKKKKDEKKKVIAKSMVVFDVKGWEAGQDLDEMAERVRQISVDGLLWSGDIKKLPVAYGVFMLRIGCVVEDDKVSVDWIQEQIEAFEDIVQSVEIHAFSKI